ncbi:hypothetical protein LGT39_02820 [Demequina sp. TTPB684]|uniref:hypothetical protein n=1 Tax=unclassified Demequina TaxID=2620311 RepID=UPI001CF4424E|nr:MULTISPECIES: hypothetical protein [unclassified Demequina]MCB2411781.1 hypothetical protein [Demequina sp. TTPB684]UPU89010.1 hypothetical protein LGT36_003550 [Demequina sp. TMPB413]
MATPTFQTITPPTSGDSVRVLSLGSISGRVDYLLLIAVVYNDTYAPTSVTMGGLPFTEVDSAAGGGTNYYLSVFKLDTRSLPGVSAESITVNMTGSTSAALMIVAASEVSTISDAATVVSSTAATVTPTSPDASTSAQLVLATFGATNSATIVLGANTIARSVAGGGTTKYAYAAYVPKGDTPVWSSTVGDHHQVALALTPRGTAQRWPRGGNVYAPV